MEIKTLYRTNNNGKVTVTPNKPTDETPYTETYRLIADEGKVLSDGVNTYPCIDTDYPENYTEITEPSETDSAYTEAGKILLGVSE